METFDIYTADGLRAGRTAPKGAPCREGEFYLGAHMYLYDSQGRFLLQKRAETKSIMPGEWQIHMGHAKAGESGLDAARRELAEEIGVTVPSERFVHVARFVWRRYHHLIDVFFCRADPEGFVLQREEVSAVKWISKGEMMAFVEALEDKPVGYREAVLEYLRNAF